MKVTDAQVARAEEAYLQHQPFSSANRHSGIRAALESLGGVWLSDDLVALVLADLEESGWRATPSMIRKQMPTPEPTGLGAVVEDIDGLHWVRRSDVHFVSPNLPNDVRTYGEIAAVKVLSDGVAL